MPLYEYKCPQCGRFEIIHKFSDAPVSSCPSCGREVEKLPSAPAIQFKGTGWYITDYARKASGGDGSEAKKGGGASASEGTPSTNTSKDGAASGSSPSKSSP